MHEQFMIYEQWKESKELSLNKRHTYCGGNWNRIGSKFKHSESTKFKISIANKGKTRPQTEEHKLKISLAKTGKTLSTEHKEKIRKAGLGRTVSDETRIKLSELNSKENNPRWGVKVSDETKAKLSVAGTGRITSEKTKLKLSEIKSKKLDILSPEGFVLEQISLREFCINFNFKYSIVRTWFNEYKKPYKGFQKL